MDVQSLWWSSSKLSCSLLNDLEFYIVVMKYMGGEQSVARLIINCTFSIHLYSKLVNVKVLLLWGNVWGKKHMSMCLEEGLPDILWPLNCGTCWRLILNIGNTVNKKKLLMLANLMLASKPSVSQCLVFFFCLLQHTGGPLAPSPVFWGLFCFSRAYP